MLPIILIDGVEQEFSAYKVDIRGKERGSVGVGATITIWRGDPGTIVEEVVAETEKGKPAVTARKGWTGTDHQTYKGEVEFPPNWSRDGRLIYALYTKESISEVKSS